MEFANLRAKIMVIVSFYKRFAVMNISSSLTFNSYYIVIASNAYTKHLIQDFEY